jgi:hypothetical protein
MEGKMRSISLIAFLLIGATTCLGQSIRKLPDLAKDRWNFQSPLWEQATKQASFKSPGDTPAAAKQATDVRLAHDGEFLFVRFTAFDDAVDQVKAAEFDEFGDEFPQGDHGEIWITNAGTQVFGFDPNGNKYDAHQYDRRYSSGFRVKSRKAADRWESIIIIPLKKLYRIPTATLQLTFVRHLDRGGPVERSTATGQGPHVRQNFTLEQ